MRLLLLFLFLTSSGMLKAQDSLNVLFRAYDTEGHVIAGEELKSPENWVLQTNEDAWQHLRLAKDQENLMVILKGDSFLLRIDIHPSKTDALKTLVLPRLQFGTKHSTIKVNSLTCSWQGSIATALDYRFINPLDGHQLRIIQSSCQSDSFRTEQGKHSNLQVLSDSVMLLKCGKREGVFLKYFLHADGVFEIHPSKRACEGFEEPEQLALFRFFIGDPSTIQLELNGYEALFLRANCLLKMRLE